MPDQTHKYFQPDPPALDGEDSAEVDGITLTTRRICRALGLPNNATSYLFQAGSASGADWLRVSDNLYPAISAELTAAELATVVSVAPSGFATSSNIALFQPKPGKKNLVVIGDSLSAGVAAVDALEDAPAKQALDLIQPTKEYDREPEKRCWYNDTWALCNLALGSSSYANTNAAGGIAAYPQRFDLAFAQRIQTLNLNDNEENFILKWLGTNDLTYDTSLTGAQAWLRAETAINQLRTEFPNVPIILGTPIRRSESVTLNGRLKDYRDEMLANYLTAGADYVVRFDLANAVFDLDTGDSTNLTYYAGDETHLTASGYGQCATQLRTLLLTL